MSEDQELDSCELGLAAYWNKVYAKEMSNFKKHGDVGEVWFGEDSALRVVKWLTNTTMVAQSDAIIDIGCGNGMTLIELAREGFSNLLGVDYSKPAIELATLVCKDQGLEIKYEVLDITEDIRKYTGKFKVVHDKGTYDAVSLNPDDSKSKRLIYIERVAQLLHKGGIFIITSCNWTESELRDHFKYKFNVKKVLPTPQYQFGGKVGNVVTCIIFDKIN